MAEDNQNEGDSSGEQREQGGQSAPKQDNNSVSKKVKIIVGLFLMLILTIAILSSIWFNPGDPPPDYFASGKVTCNDWASAPAGYQTAITNTANKIGIQPALLGAIFLDEHNDQWPQQGMNDPWERGGNGIGPFQIEEWDKKWSAYIDRVAKERGYTAPANPGAEKATFDESALLAGSFLRVLAKSEVGDIDPMTTNENEIKCLGAAYNSGPADCKKWRENNYTGDVDVTDNYHIRTWTNFQKLYVGCQNSTGTSGDKPSPKFIRNIQGSWLNTPGVKGKMKISGVVLHWTAGNSVESAVKAMTDRQSYVQLIIDTNGKVYQLLPLDTRVRSGSGDGNSFAVGIEIVSIASNSIEENEKALRKNGVQLNAVKETVEYLIDTYNIPNLRGNSENLRAKKGIFGHYQVQGPWSGSYVKGCQGRKSDPGKEYMKDIWTLLKSEGDGC